MSSGSNVTNVVPSLPAGDCITVNIILTIDADFTGTSIVNYAEITEDDGDDIDSTADSNDTNDSGGEPGGDTDDVTDNSNGDEDDHDPAEIEVLQESKVYDLALTKSLAPGQSSTVSAGDVVSYNITVYNQGEEKVNNVLVNDYFPAGLILNDANWSLTASSTATNTLQGSIAAGGQITVSISFTITADATGSLTNFAEISSFMLPLTMAR